MLCDKYTDTATSTSIEGKSASASATITEGTGATLDSSSNQKKDEDHLLLKLEKEKRQRVKGDTAALPQIPQQNIDWCFQAREKYNVQPLKSWGQLPMNMIESWGQRQCDLAFTAARMSRKPLATCIGKTRHASGTWIASVPIDGSSSVVPQQSAAGKVSTILTSLFGNRFSTSNNTSAISKSATATATATSGSETYSDIKSLPLIAIMAASTTRRIKDPSTSNLALFTLMLPSLIRTLDCGYRYMYVLGFDKGDPFYDSDEVSLFHIYVYTYPQELLYLYTYIIYQFTYFIHLGNVEGEKVV